MSKILEQIAITNPHIVLTLTEDEAFNFIIHLINDNANYKVIRNIQNIASTKFPNLFKKVILFSYTLVETNSPEKAFKAANMEHLWEKGNKNPVIINMKVDEPVGYQNN